MEGGTHKKNKVAYRMGFERLCKRHRDYKIRVCRPGKSRIYIKHQLAAGSAAHT